MVAAFLRSLAFNVFFFASCAVYSVVLALATWLPRIRIQQMIRSWMVAAFWALRVMTGIRFEVRGRENLPPGPAILASKHQSAWDTGIYYMLVPDPAYVLKRELIRIPFYGLVLKRVEMVAVDRNAGAGAMKSLIRQSKRALDENRHVVIFPEGTRGAVGRRGDFHPGVAALDRAFDVPIVPVALNSGLHWPRRSFFKHPGTIVIEFLPAMRKGLDRRAFMKELQDRIETATERLVAEEAGPSA